MALWTHNGSAAPPEYADYILCKLLHCLPSQLEDEDAETMRLYLAFHNAEEMAQEAARKASEGSAKGRGR